MRKRAAWGLRSPLCIMWELESPSCRPHSFSSFPPKNITNSYWHNTTVFVRVLGGRDGLPHSGKIVVGNRTQWCERNNFAPPLLEGRAGLFVRDRNTLRGSCELMPFWLKPLLCPSSSSFDHRQFKFSVPVSKLD